MVEERHMVEMDNNSSSCIKLYVVAVYCYQAISHFHCVSILEELHFEQV